MFAEQCATREFEELVFEWAFEDIKPQLGLDFVRVDNTNLNHYSGSGEFDANFLACDDRGRGGVCVNWKDRSKGKLNISISPSLILAIPSFAVENNWMGNIQITGWTRFKMSLPGLVVSCV